MLRLDRVTRNVAAPGDDPQWILYHDGKYSEPIAIVSDSEIDFLLDSIERQRQAASKPFVAARSRRRR